MPEMGWLFSEWRTRPRKMSSAPVVPSFQPSGMETGRGEMVSWASWFMSGARLIGWRRQGRRGRAGGSEG